MKTLVLDVELAPNLATVWGIYKQTISINQLLETSRVLCYAAKWVGTNKIIFGSEQKNSHEEMVEELWDLLDEADAVIHYNGNNFDIPVINREFLKYNYMPPTPYHNIDLLTTVRKQFRFSSNKLDHVCDELGLGRKVNHSGHQLWLDCMDGDKAAWKVMEKYNKQDVQLTEKLYDRLLPWIKGHPNAGLYTDEEVTVCPKCGSTHIKKNGIEHTTTMSYQRYRCMDCSSPLRSRTNILTKEKRDGILTTSKL